MTSNSLQPATLLLGFVPFFRKEIQEWKQQKQSAIAVILLISFVLSLVGVLLVKLAEQTGNALIGDGADHLTLAATGSATNPVWLASVSILLSIGLIPNEEVSGTLAWNLTKPLSRLSFLLGKGLSQTLMIWLVAVVFANLIGLIVGLIGLGGGDFSIPTVLLANIFALLPIAFWVLFCLFAGTFLKDQAAIGATAIVLAAGGAGLASAQALGGLSPNAQAWLNMIAPFYPTSVIDGFLDNHSINFSKLALYLLYMAALSIATHWMFDRKELS